MREAFDKQLIKLHNNIIQMGNLVENAIDNTIEAFKNQDKDLGKEIINNDRVINDLQRTIESRSFHLMLSQQPIAKDLRTVTTALKVVTDLERIGDQSADIAEIMIEMEGEYPYKTVEHIPCMLKQAKVMVHESIEAFVNNNVEKIQEIVKMDDEIDYLFNEVKSEIVDILKEDLSTADDCLRFLMIAKYLERIGDHAVNICEWLEFLNTGTIDDEKII